MKARTFRTDVNYQCAKNDVMQNESNFLQDTHVKQIDAFTLQVKKRSDSLMNYFLAAFFLVGLVLAFFYDTWFVALGVGSLSLLAYYSVKLLAPESNLYQYVLSGVFGIFMAQ